MRQLLISVLLAFCCVLRLEAQNVTSVSASNIQKGGAPLSSGTLCFTATDSSDNPIGFRVGGGGQEVVAPYCAAITNGAISGLQVANPANTAPANISYRVEVFDQYTRVLKYSGVQFSGATFNFDNYVPSSNLPLGASANVLSVGNLTITGSCTGCGSGGGGSGYATIQNAGAALAQRATANFLSGISCADNSGASRTDCQVDQSFSPNWSGAHTFNGNVNLAGGFKINGAATQGKIPIGDGTNFVPGDPLVQGTQADGSTATANPVVIGGYDTAGTPAIHRAVALNASPAGTEYGIVTRPIPGGTQSISGAVTANAGSGTFNIQANASVNQTQVAGAAIDVNSGVKSAGTQRIVIATDQPQLTNALKVDGSAVTQPVSGTVTANQGGAPWSVNQTQIGGTGIVADPCQQQAKIYTPISLTANTKLLSGVSAKKYYICEIHIIAGAATNVAIVEGTGTVCATGTAGIFGGATAATGWNLAANGGLVLGNGASAVGVTATAADDLCLLVSAANQISGNLVTVNF